MGKPVDLAAFAGNVYVLDEVKKTIWKIMPLEKGYAKPVSYLGQGQTISLAQPVSLAIDGSVWVLGDNQIRLYTKGKPEEFFLTGLDQPLVEATAIFTNEESQFLYLLDQAGERVVVFDKKGVYHSEYRWSGLKGVSDLVVLEKAKKMLLLAGSFIYAIDLNI